MHNSRLLRVALGLSMASSSCWFKKTPPNFTTLPPQTLPAPPADQPPAVLDPPPPTTVESDSSAPPPAIPPVIPEKLEPPKPKEQPHRVTPLPRVTTPSPPPEQPAPPKLRPLLTAEQLRDYNRTLDGCLARVRKALAVVEKKNLTAEQNDIVARIKTFQAQAEQAKEQRDLLTAVSLAMRADVFAQDLLDRMRLQ